MVSRLRNRNYACLPGMSLARTVTAMSLKPEDTAHGGRVKKKIWFLLG